MSQTASSDLTDVAVLLLALVDGAEIGRAWGKPPPGGN